MRRIKLFEGFSDKKLTEQEIRGALVELVDMGYNVLVSEPKVYYKRVTIDLNANFFDIINIVEPILELIAYLEEKFGNDSFNYSLTYLLYDDYQYSYVSIYDIEQFIKDNSFEETTEVRIDLIVR